MKLRPALQDSRGFWPWLIVGLVGLPDDDGAFLPGLERLGFAAPSFVPTAAQRAVLDAIDLSGVGPNDYVFHGVGRATP